MDPVANRFPGSAFVEELAGSQLQVYRHQPKELIANFNREWRAAESYRGRQLLELLQNADDAGRNAESGCSVLIRLLGDHLLVANTGDTFTADGVQSLVVSDVSPKQLEGRLIGEKGLGFRSVLTWSARPLVASGDYVVAFDPKRALETVDNLAAESERIRCMLQDWKKRQPGAADPIATMRFPYVPDPGDVRLSLAVDLLDRGYDTVVVLPFRPSDPRQEIEEQIDQISAETLLFCRNITKLTIEADTTRSWTILRDEREGHTDVVVQEDGGNDPELWRLYRKEGQLPVDLQEDEGGLKEVPIFNLGVAAPEDPKAMDPSDHRLSVFFPTEDILPCPLLAHASLSTDDSRKRLTEHDANRYVLRELAALMATVAEAEAVRGEMSRGLELLSGIQDSDPELKKLGFVDALFAEVRGKKLFPCRGGNLAPASAVRWPPLDIWFEATTAEVFPELVDAEPDAPFRAFIEQLDLGWYDEEELAERCSRQVQRLTPLDAGRFVGRLLAVRAVPGRPKPELLVGSDGDLLPLSHTAFLPGEDLDGQLPVWVRRFDFLDDDFMEGLRAGLGSTTARELRGRLERAGYEVEEFQLEGIARHLAREYRETVDESGQDPTPLARQVLSFLFHAGDWSRSRSTALEGVRIDVITETGTLRAAGSCYLGSAYPSADVVYELYRNLGEDEFVAPPSTLGLSADPAEVGRFLTWLGAADAPRYRPLVDAQNGWERDFKDHVLRSLDYPHHLAGRTYDSAGEAISELRVRFSGVQVPDRIHRLLQDAPAEAVVAFLDGDGRRHLDRPSDGVLKVLRGRQQKYRKPPLATVPDPVHVLLRSMDWIPCTDGERYPPERVMLHEGGLRILDEIFHRPRIDPEHELLEGGGGANTIRSVLARLGAVWSLESLAGDQLYRLLLHLPGNVSGEQARKIYRAILDASGVDTSSSLRVRFVKEGRMWGRLGEEWSYHPVGDLRYSPTGNVPGPVRDRVPLVAITPRSGARQVESVFGVAPLRASDYSIRIDQLRTRTREWSRRAHDRLRKTLPFMYAVRLSQTIDEDGSQKRALQRAELCVCRRVVAHVTVLEDGEEEEVVFDEDLRGLVVDDVMYLVSAKEARGLSALFDNEPSRGAIADLLSDQIGVATAQGEFARILACRSDRERMTVLDRMTGGRSEELLEEARERLQFEDEPEEIEFVPPASDEAETTGGGEATPTSGGDGGEAVERAAGTSADTAEQPVEPSDDGTGQAPAKDAGGDPGEKPQPSLTDLLAKRSFRPTPGTRHRSGGSRGHVITSGNSGGGGGSTGSQPLKENLTLEIAETFERRDGRHPLRVDHIRGWEGFGCDIVSFETKDAASAAVEKESVDPADVERFIEVKGTRSRTGRVELTKNQRAKAAELRDRYYLYRVYVSRAAEPEIQLAILSDPIDSDAEVIDPSYSYDLEEEERSKWFSLAEEPDENVE